MLSCLKSPERFERLLNLGEFGFGDETAADCVLCGLAEQLGREIFARAVVQRVPRVGRWHCTEPGAVIRRYAGVMKDNAAWDPESRAV